MEMDAKMDAKLIELVRSYPGLYDLSHKKYMDYAFKTDIWINIGRELGLEGIFCKQRWNNIRDNYRKSLKNPYRKNGKRVKVYKYADELEFLKKSFEERDKIKDKNECSKDASGGEQENYEEHIQNEADDDDDDNPLQGVDVTPRQSIPIVANEVDAESSRQSADFERRLGKRIRLSPRKVTKKRATTTTTSTTSATAPTNYSQQVHTSSQFMEYLISEKSEEPTPANTTALSSSSSSYHQQHYHQPHPVDAFLAGIGASLKTFNPYDLIAAKKEIFDVVQKYEMKMIAVQSDGGTSGGGGGNIVRVPLLNASTREIQNTVWPSSNNDGEEAEEEATGGVEEITIIKEEK